MIKLLAGTALALIVATPALSASRGKDIPLNLVVGQVVPEGWDVEMADGIDPTVPATWDGGTWRESLAQAADSAGYAARVEGKRIVIVQRGAAMTQEVETVAVVDKATAEVVPVARKVEAAPVEAVPVPWTREAVKSAPKAAPVRKAEAMTPKAFSKTTRHAAPAATVSGGGFAFVPAPEAAPVRMAKATKAYSSDAKGFAKPRPRHVPKAAPAPAPAWTVAPGADLEHVLTGWAHKAGWSLVWDNDYTFSLTSGAAFHGDFENAVVQLVQAMSGVRPAPTAEFWGGNRTLVIGANSAGIVN